MEIVVQDSGITTHAQLEELPVEDAKHTIQYFDGLGRPIQKVGWQASPSKKDIIQHMEYDAFGRENRQYLPYVSDSIGSGAYRIDGNGDVHDFYSSTSITDIVRTPYPYSETIFEKSPLHRVQEQGAAGAVWQPSNPSIVQSGHTIKYEYTTNGEEEVRLYEVFVPTLELSGYYAPGELYVTVTKDENWQSADGDNHTIKEYTDKQGRVVLKRTYNEGTAHDTYYVYDDYGNLTYVLPPKSEANSAKPDATKLDELCYQYQYDRRNRLVEQKVPGKGWVYIVYNTLDQPILTRDTLLEENDQWLFTKYDAFGRIVYTGTVHNPSGREAQQGSADNTTVYQQYEERLDTVALYTNDATPVYYSNKAMPRVLNDKILTINYYDDYAFDKAGLTVPTTVLGQTVDTRTKTLATGSKTRVLGTNHWITTIHAYDQKGRLIYTASTNPYLNTTDIVEYELDFPGKILQTQTTHTKGSNSAVVTVDHFDYDHMGRLLTHTQEIDGQAEELIAENVYDELGQLAQKKVGNSSTTPLQEMDYRYNVRGWLTDINDVDNPGDDLFNFQINYNSSRSGVVDPLYNGNIAETYWKTGNDNTLRRYAYSYDALNRITSGLYNNSGSSESNRYSVQGIAYDKNGNIEALTRRGHLNSGATSFGIMDNLSYTYNAGNKLLKVDDNGNTTYGFKDGSNTGNDYTYDPNGNVLTDANKGITGTTYNHLNLPTQINFGSDKIMYIYDASGVKLKKEVTEGSSVTEMEYAGKYIYENGQLRQFGTTEGYVEPDGSTYRYVYQYKDHLGNVRLSYSDLNGDGIVGTSEIIQENNYYPFGALQKGYNNVIRGTESNYQQYQGQELDESLNLGWHHFKYRTYDALTGRFLQIDPLATTYVYNSTYAFAENNVTSGIDLEGKELSFELDGNRATAVYGPRQGTYTLQEVRSIVSKKQAEQDALLNRLSSMPTTSAPQATIGYPSSHISKAKYNPASGLMIAEGVGIGAKEAVTDIALGAVVGKVAQGIRTLKNAKLLKLGKWIHAGESMSNNAASYQKLVTGVDADISFKVNGVKFDGVTEAGVLLDAKSGMQNFVDNAGNFKGFFTGKQGILDQATRQIDAARGTKIQWHFENENVMKAYQNLFNKEGIQGIELIHTPRN